MGATGALQFLTRAPPLLLLCPVLALLELATYSTNITKLSSTLVLVVFEHISYMVDTQDTISRLVLAYMRSFLNLCTHPQSNMWVSYLGSLYVCVDDPIHTIHLPCCCAILGGT